MAELKNARHELFAQGVAKGMSQDDAYRAAGYSSKNPGALRGNASRLRSIEIVLKRIEELQKEIAQKVIEEEVVTRAEVLRELKKIGFADISDLYDNNGHLKSFHDIPEHARKAIAGVEVDELFEGFGKEREKIGLTKKVKLWDKNKALENLGRYLKLFTDKVEHSGTVELAERLKEARERAKRR
jgi:phage terminase small subunit